jgi:uncharacterized protein
MGLSPCKRCSLDFGSEHHGFEPRSQHLHASVSDRHVSRRAGCRACGFAFGIVAAAVWLYILTPLQTATLIMGLGLVVQGYSVWKLRHALHWRRLTPILVGTALGVPLGVFTLSHADPRYLRLGIGAVLVLFSLYGLWRPTIKPIKAGAMVGDLGAGFLNGVLGGATGLAGIVAVIWCQLRGWAKDQQRAVFQPVGVAASLPRVMSRRNCHPRK